jgi:hypothetical protein
VSKNGGTLAGYRKHYKNLYPKILKKNLKGKYTLANEPLQRMTLHKTELCVLRYEYDQSEF